MSEYSSRQTGNKQPKPHPNCKLTPKVQEIICDWISKGNYPSKACQAAGISDETLRNWVKRAEEGDEFYFGFLEAVKKAEAQASVERIARIQEAAKGGAVITKKTVTRRDGSVEVSETYAPPQWQADAWTSERKEPQEWGRVDRVQLRHTMSPETERYMEALEAYGRILRLKKESPAVEGEYREISDGDCENP